MSTALETTVKTLVAVLSDLHEEVQNLHATVRELRDAAKPLPKVNYKCPLCEERMILRQRKDGTGGFYGCSDFPSCTGIRDVEGNENKKKASESRPRPRQAYCDDDEDEIPF